MKGVNDINKNMKVNFKVFIRITLFTTITLVNKSEKQINGTQKIQNEPFSPLSYIRSVFLLIVQVVGDDMFSAKAMYGRFSLQLKLNRATCSLNISKPL